MFRYDFEEEQLPKPSQDNVTIELSKVWHLNIIEARDDLRSVIDKRTRMNIFDQLYGHLFPKDEKDRSVLSPAVAARTTGMSKDKVREAIERQKDELNSEGLLFEMTENNIWVWLLKQLLTTYLGNQHE